MEMQHEDLKPAIQTGGSAGAPAVRRKTVESGAKSTDRVSGRWCGGASASRAIHLGNLQKEVAALKLPAVHISRLR